MDTDKCLNPLSSENAFETLCSRVQDQEAREGDLGLEHVDKLLTDTYTANNPGTLGIPGRNEADSEPLHRVAREVVGKPRARLGIRRQEFSKTIRVSVDNDCVGDPNSRTSTPRLVGRVGEHTSESGSTRQSITVLSVRSGVLRSIRGQHWGTHTEKPACRRRYRHGASGRPEVSQNVLGRV